MNSPRDITEQELKELNRELEKVILRVRGKDEIKHILDDIQTYVMPLVGQIYYRVIAFVLI